MVPSTHSTHRPPAPAGLLYGNPALGREGVVQQGNLHVELWFGTGCLRSDPTTCPQPGDELYEVRSMCLHVR